MAKSSWREIALIVNKLKKGKKMKNNNGLSQWLGELARRLSGNAPTKSRKFKEIYRQICALGLIRVPGDDDCGEFVRVKGEEFNFNTCTLEDLEAMAEIQNPGRCGESGSRTCARIRRRGKPVPSVVYRGVRRPS